MTVLLLVAGILVAVVGLAGTFLPTLPGAPLLLAGLVLVAWSDGFARVGLPTFVVLTVLTVLAYGADLVAGALGARRVGASARAVWGAALGGFVGIFFGLPGLVAGPFLGAFAGELSVRREWRRAGRVGLGTWLGVALGAVAKIALAVAMLGVFALAWLR